MQRYNKEDLDVIIESLTRRGYRYISEDTKGSFKRSRQGASKQPLRGTPVTRGYSRVTANNKILNWVRKKRKALEGRYLVLADLGEIEPHEWPPESEREYDAYEKFRNEFTDFKNVLFEIDLINVPALVADTSIKEYVEARLELGI